MRFVGVDLAWGARGGTGLCVVSDGRVRESTRLTTDDEIIAWIGATSDSGCVVAIDAPLIVNNVSGRRRCECLISRCFGAQHAGAHASNLGLAAFAGGIRGARLAARLGLDVDPWFPPRSDIRRAIEVYPHPALVALFGLDFALKYKAKRGRGIEARRAVFGQLLRLLETLGTAELRLDVTASPRWAAIVDGIATANGAELDRIEDEVDSYVCAYVGLYYWTHGEDRCRIVGDLDDGYIVTPVTDRHAACLDAASAAPTAGAA